MAILEILQYPDPRLHLPAARVEKIDSATRKLVSDMAETMYASEGVGLAATQVNVHQQVIVIDVSPDHTDLRVFINPEIIRREGMALNQEGCLSVPGIYENVERADSVTVTALDENGARPDGVGADDGGQRQAHAQILQHRQHIAQALAEVSHADVLIVDDDGHGDGEVGVIAGIGASGEFAAQRLRDERISVQVHTDFALFIIDQHHALRVDDANACGELRAQLQRGVA